MAAKKPKASSGASTKPVRAARSSGPVAAAAQKAAASKAPKAPAGGKHRMQILESAPLMQAAAMALRQRNVTVGLVPTMGALHRGHLALMEQARAQCDVVVASIFVNPAQFGPQEDLESYPRDREGDTVKCRQAGVDVLFMPSAADMYPAGFQTTVRLGAITQGACGRFRTEHFAGVSTVVCKLFNLVAPHMAYFGEKDYQQLAVVRRMVKDLDMPVEVVGTPTLREPDGLALSSRNLHLSPRDREQAPVLYRALLNAQQAWKEGTKDAAGLCKLIVEDIRAARGVKLQYVEVVDADIQPVRFVDRPCRILMAAHLGKVRLIDNVPVGPGTKLPRR